MRQTRVHALIGAGKRESPAIRPAAGDRRECALSNRARHSMTLPGQPSVNPQPDAASLRLSVAPMMDWTASSLKVIDFKLLRRFQVAMLR
ncbi:hypothetical protein ACFONC_00935 [Luteimonas soli]|uniref:DUS-like FMN-binding domain-containing protein n=1 Tax=Luteimonas soli TaxID=1648966 RepID=A0ABV7XH96_9GAMM